MAVREIAEIQLHGVALAASTKTIKDLFMERAGVGLLYQKEDDSTSWLPTLLLPNLRTNTE